MAREQFFVASIELVSDIISTWRAAGATFVRSSHTGQSRTLLASPEDDLAKGHAFRFFVYDASPASIKLLLESVEREGGELLSYVQQRYGSPYIDFHFIKARKTGDVVVAGHGSLAIYPCYYHLDANEKIKPSARLRPHRR